MICCLQTFHGSFKTGTPPITGKTARPPTVDEATKQTLKNALLGMLGMSVLFSIVANSWVSVRLRLAVMFAHVELNLF